MLGAAQSVATSRPPAQSPQTVLQGLTQQAGELSAMAEKLAQDVESKIGRTIGYVPRPTSNAELPPTPDILTERLQDAISRTYRALERIGTEVDRL